MTPVGCRRAATMRVRPGRERWNIGAHNRLLFLPARGGREEVPSPSRGEGDEGAFTFVGPCHHHRRLCRDGGALSSLTLAAKCRHPGGNADASAATVRVGLDAGGVQEGVPLAAQEERRAGGSADHRRGDAGIDRVSEGPCASITRRAAQGVACRRPSFSVWKQDLMCTSETARPVPPLAGGTPNGSFQGGATPPGGTPNESFQVGATPPWVSPTAARNGEGT